MRPIFSNLSIKAACDFTESRVRVLQALSDGRIISAVDLPAQGIKDGRIVRVDQFSEVIWQAASQAENQSGFPIKSFAVSMDDDRLQSQKIHGSSHTDIGSEGFEKKHLKEAELHALQALAPNDLQLVYQKEAGYLIDRKDYLQNPIGICGHELTVVLHLLFSETDYVQNIQFAVERAGRTLKGLYPSGLTYRRATQVADVEESKNAICILNETNAHIVVFQNNAIQTYQSLIRSHRDADAWLSDIADRINHSCEGVDAVGLVGEAFDGSVRPEQLTQNTQIKCEALKPTFTSVKSISASFSAAYGAILLDEQLFRPRIARITSQFKKSITDKTKQFIYEYFG